MTPSVLPDAGGPGLILVALAGGLAALAAFTAVVVFLEALVLFLFKWAGFWRSVLAALIVNMASTLVGGLLLAMFRDSVVWALLASFGLSVVVEGGLLAVTRWGRPGRGWLAVIAANLASYVLVALPLALWVQSR